MSVYSDISGVILAGGKNSRIGFPKAFLKLNQRRIIDHALEVLQSFFNEILIVAENKNDFSEYNNIKVVEDLVKGCGPLGGIYTGLKTICNDSAFFIACDMPFLDRGLITRILNIAKEGSHTYVVPYSERGLEPLHAVYSKVGLECLQHCLDQGQRSVREFLHRCNCRYVQAQKDEIASFYNINTKDDLQEIVNDQSRSIKNRRA